MCVCVCVCVCVCMDGCLLVCCCCFHFVYFSGDLFSLFYLLLIFYTILISKIRCHFSCDASEIDSKLCL